MQNIYFLGLEISTLLVVLSIMLMWASNIRVWQLAYFLTLVVALLSSSISIVAIVIAVTLVGLIKLYQRRSKYSLVSFFALIAVGIALGMHVLPGFNNHEYAAAIRLSSRSAEFDIWFNYDKSMFGVLVLGLLFHAQLIRSLSELKRVTQLITPPILIGIPAIYAFAYLMAYSSFDFTASTLFFPWVLKNLFFTVIAEEILFRGLIQSELAIRIKHKNAADIAMIIAAFLFGLAHFAGGVGYIVLASIAGLLYGYTYKITGRIEAPIITHLLLNSAHFIFFAYPYSLT